MTALQIIFGFLLTIFIIVGVHEYGHYLAARLCGVTALRFSIGLGKPLLSRTDSRGTEWVLAPYPLGGYLQMVQTEAEAASRGLEAGCSFEGRPLWHRSVIVAAGPAANFLLAALLFFVAALYGTEGLRARVGSVVPESIAASAGFRPGEDIVALDGREVQLWSEVYEGFFVAASHRDVAASVSRAGGTPSDRFLELSGMAPSVLEDGNIVEKIGLRPDQTYLSVVLDEVVADSPAEQAGLLAGDAIIGMDGNPVSAWQEIVAAIRASPARPLQIAVLRGDEQLDLEATPAVAEGSDGASIGQLGIVPAVDRERFGELYVVRRSSLAEASASAVHRTAEAIWLTYRFIGNLIVREISIESISGPVGIATFAGRAVDFGAYAFLVFLAHISISLGALNLLPIPILDGGHLLQFAVEGALRRRLSEVFLHAARIFGVCCILLLMGVAIYNDLT